MQNLLQKFVIRHLPSKLVSTDWKSVRVDERQSNRNAIAKLAHLRVFEKLEELIREKHSISSTSRDANNHFRANATSSSKKDKLSHNHHLTGSSLENGF